MHYHNDTTQANMERSEHHTRIQSQTMRTLIISILLYACETWTLTIELQRRIKAVEMRCYRRLLHISYKDHITNEIVCTKIQTAIGPYEDLLTTVKKGSYDDQMASVKRSYKAQ